MLLHFWRGTGLAAEALVGPGACGLFAEAAETAVVWLGADEVADRPSAPDMEHNGAQDVCSVFG